MKKTFKYSAFALALGVIGLTTACTTLPPTTPKTIEQAVTVSQYHFIKNMQNPEDLVAIPDSKWIIASGMAPQSGLHLIDSENKTATRWLAPKASAPSDDYPNSSPQPHADEMQVHGISLHMTGKGKALLYAVNHNGKEAQNHDRETIEIFEVNLTTTTPSLTWLGNVRLPKGSNGKDLAGNAVVSDKDGNIYVSVMLHPEYSMDELMAGKTTGAVYRWTVKSGQFEKLIGTELGGNNGIELSPDGRYLYANHTKGVSKFTTTNPAHKVASFSPENGIVADNIHWHNGKLIVSGPVLKDCGAGMAMDCFKGFHLSHVNPDDLRFDTVLKHDDLSRQGYGNVSVALTMGDTVWLGSFAENKLAYFDTK